MFFHFFFLYAVLYLRDRLRTTTNVLGDSIGAGIVEFLSRHELRSKDVEMGNSVLEERERKKPYKLISQDSDFENDKRAHSESNMQVNPQHLLLVVFISHCFNLLTFLYYHVLKVNFLHSFFFQTYIQNLPCVSVRTHSFCICMFTTLMNILTSYFPHVEVQIRAG